ncbi:MULTISPECIES: ABC transporter permease [unclassified Mesorhizobium]|uniref:ABC transporter permease n=1 Tax=unclassified Mesorhizobium TaxID=325217 RepID=UPI00112C0FD8|nr:MULTISPECIES: ABC transporter permease [unclassified Mesorhizobium]MBZ9959044.1 ABC transporter permease [Mesorhizobium sp. BR1-1-14]MBZ9980711.1 ABC transporter permease [Mesorhizobium sp. BR-1-1-8]TPL33168.1 ABC transporter permease [Mesorhizobium sp. B2-4-8]TPL65553.1 ABC transporter permease [Mesorhizobium sp. B2-4-1]
MTAVQANPAPRRSALWRAVISGTGIVALIYVLLYALYAFWQPDALSVYTFTDLVNNSTPLALAAAGETLVVISRGFDLSVAGVVSLTNVLMAVYPFDGPGGALASLLMCCAIGGAVGAINGILVARLGLQTIAATLGTMIVCQGLALVILDAPGGMVADFVTYTLTDTLFGIIPIAGLFLVAAIALWLAFRRTNTGIGLYAIGADEQSARFSGVPVAGVRITAFVGAGILYGVAGFMLSAQTATGNPTAGTPFLMLTFAAVALGGTPLSGGRGSLVGSILGAGTLMLLQKVLFSGGVSSFYTGIFQGFVLVLAIVFGSAVARLLKKEEIR